ncbi:S-adenosyl-L-methionine-dependent methyltransferase [Schizophyllum fasciatum]
MTKLSAFAVIRAANLDPKVTEVLDYACGAGTVSCEFAPLVKSIVGADISQGMLAEFEKNKTDNMAAKLVDGTILPEAQFDGRKFDLIICCAAYHHFDSPKSMTISLGKLLKPGGQLIVIDFASGGHEALLHHHHHHGQAHEGQKDEQQDVSLAEGYQDEHPPEHSHGHHHKHHHSSQAVQREPTMSSELLEQAKTTIVHKHGFARSELEEWMELAGLKRFTFDTFPPVHAFNTDAVAFSASAYAV